MKPQRTAAAVLLGAVLAAGVLVALPAAAQDPPLLGTWQPLSRALEPLGPLVLAEGRIAWSICHGARVQRTQLRAAAVFTLEGEPGCVLDGQRITHLKLAPRAGRCDAELTLYTSAAALQQSQPEAWGLVERDGCP